MCIRDRCPVLFINIGCYYNIIMCVNKELMNIQNNFCFISKISMNRNTNIPKFIYFLFSVTFKLIAHCTAEIFKTPQTG